MKISACLIVRNEERNLPRCLGSLRGLVDEIIAVDSGSSDDTKGVVHRFGGRWVSHPWAGYVAQKNYAISLAAHSWVLSIDADEELSAELQQSIMKLRILPDQELPAGYEVGRLVSYRGKWIYHGDWYPDKLVRLFQKEKARFSGGRVHERLEVDGPISALAGHLHHYTYTDPQDREQRIQHYADLWAQSAHERGKRANWMTAITHAAWRLFRGFIIKRGFMDGPVGWDVAWGSAREVYLKYRLLSRLMKKGDS